MIDRFMAKVSRDEETGCWSWTGCVTSTGYGRVWNGQRSDWAHRVIYKLASRTIPDGLVLDHLCRNRRCVNPDHLEPVTDRQNTMRGVNPEATRARHKSKTHCLRGHPLFGLNIRIDNRGHRICRACNAIHRQASQLRRSADVLLELANQDDPHG